MSHSPFRLGRAGAVRRRTKGIAITAAVVGALALSACSGSDEGSAYSAGDTVTVALGGDPLTLNPFDYRAGVNFYGSSQLYERLLSRDAEGELIPWLASDWEVSDDGLTYTFTLRDDVVFHDGTPMTAADVKFSLERFADPEIMPYAFLIASLDTIETPDDHTVVVNFSKPAPIFLSGMGLAHIVPASIGDQPNDYLDAKAIGTGPFTLESRSVGQGFELKRFDDYWGDKSGFAGVDVKVIADSNARVSALRSGQADFVVPVPSQNADQLESKFTVESTIDSNTVGIGFDLKSPGEAGVVADQDVRRAMDLAIDREAIVKTALNGFAEVHGGIAPQNPGNDQVPAVEYDPDEAKKLIEKAGATGETVKLFVPKNGRVTSSEQVGQAVAAYWDEIGLKTDLRIVSYEEWIDKIQNGPAQTYMTFQGDETVWSPLVRLQSFYGCAGPTSHVCDEDLDALAAAAAVAPSQDAFVDGYVKAFQHLQDNSLGVQLYVQKAVFGMAQGVCWTPPVGRSIPLLTELAPCD